MTEVTSYYKQLKLNTNPVLKPICKQEIRQRTAPKLGENMKDVPDFLNKPGAQAKEDG